eukprot:SAG31_NODE_1018_length_10354_cov_10.995514_1_plen_201_part_00
MQPSCAVGRRERRTVPQRLGSTPPVQPHRPGHAAWVGSASGRGARTEGVLQMDAQAAIRRLRQLRILMTNGRERAGNWRELQFAAAAATIVRAQPLPHGWQTPPKTSTREDGYKMTEEQKYQFDLNGFFILKQYYDAQSVAEFHRGIDELQAIPVDHAEYTRCAACDQLCLSARVEAAVHLKMFNGCYYLCYYLKCNHKY